MSHSQHLQSFIQQRFDDTVAGWQQSLEASWSSSLTSVKQVNLKRQCESLLRAFIDSLSDNASARINEELVTLLSEVGSIWAKKGLTASQTSHFIISLKETLYAQLKGDSARMEIPRFAMFELAQARLDGLLVICHEAYTNSREKLIKQQSAALLELSSPVVKMWQETLLVPLIGVIDTARAKQITESLLSEITAQEATVAVLDLTGVPVFDTAVAGHLIKTINAARMLGCKIIMTGISPEGALVLTKLGIEFKDVITRGNLHSGVKAAFSLQGLSIIQHQEA